MVSHVLQLHPRIADAEIILDNFTAAIPAELPNRARDNAFLEALRDVDYGQLSVVTPEGERLEFRGRYKGPQAMIAVNDWDVFGDMVSKGEIGFAEAYMDGRWDTPDITTLVTFGLLNNSSLEQFFYGRPLYALWLRIKSALRENSIPGSRRNIKEHYDLGNDFYALWLDESMTYSGALFEGNRNRSLEEAQCAKYQRILNCLGVKKGEHILEIGCGWGGFAAYAAQQGIRVTAITVSERQAAYALERLSEIGLTDMVSVEFCDYREVKGLYDHVVSIGMFEHVGEKYWPDFFRTIRMHLKTGGKAMVQSITLDAHLFESLRGCTGFIDTYIFPGGMLPSKYRFEEAAYKEGIACNKMFCFGDDYAITLEHWLKRFESNVDVIRKMGYDERFIRMWRFYLSSCIAGFLTRRVDVMQVELSVA